MTLIRAHLTTHNRKLRPIRIDQFGPELVLNDIFRNRFLKDENEPTKWRPMELEETIYYNNRSRLHLRHVAANEARIRQQIQLSVPQTDPNTVFSGNTAQGSYQFSSGASKAMIDAINRATGSSFSTTTTSTGGETVRRTSPTARTGYGGTYRKATSGNL